MKVQLIGRAGAGKDTFAKLLQNELYESYLYQMDIKRFAEPLKGAAYRAFGEGFDNRLTKEVETFVSPLSVGRALDFYNEIMGLQLTDATFKPVMSPRFFQQELGRLTKLAKGNDAFVHRLADCDDIIITDTRFEEEIIDKDDTYVFFLFRENMEFIEDHPSEQLAIDLYNEVKDFNEKHSFKMVETNLPGIEAPINILYAETLDEAMDVAHVVAENLMEGNYA